MDHLPVGRRVEFKLSTLVYRSFTGTAPAYLDDECMLVTAAGRRPLQSADSRTCIAKSSRRHVTSRCWANPVKQLPEQLRQPDITFKRLRLVSMAAAPCC